MSQDQGWFHVSMGPRKRVPLLCLPLCLLLTPACPPACILIPLPLLRSHVLIFQSSQCSPLPCLTVLGSVCSWEYGQWEGSRWQQERWAGRGWQQWSPPEDLGPVSCPTSGYAGASTAQDPSGFPGVWNFSFKNTHTLPLVLWYTGFVQWNQCVVVPDLSWFFPVPLDPSKDHYSPSILTQA